MNHMKKDITFVTKNNLCFNCGACGISCHSKSISFHITNAGRLHPKINYDTCTDCEECYNVCPGFDSQENIFNNLNKKNFYGNTINSYIGRTKNQLICQNAQSGGMITSTLDYLFKQNLIKYALVVKMDHSYEPEAEYFFATSIDELFTAQKSKSIPIDLLSALNKIKYLDGDLAIVGLPCHIEGIVSILKHKPKKYNKIKYKLGLICGRNFSFLKTKYYSQYSNDYHKIIYKSKSKTDSSRRYDLIENFKNTEFKIIPENETQIINQLTTLPRCRLCLDKMNVHADIVFGNPWGLVDVNRKHEDSVVITRTELGNNIINRMIKLSEVNLKNVNYKDILKGERVDNKIEKAFQSADAYKKLGFEVPSYFKSLSHTNSIDIQKKITDFLAMEQNAIKSNIQNISNKIKQKLQGNNEMTQLIEKISHHIFYGPNIYSRAPIILLNISLSKIDKKYLYDLCRTFQNNYMKDSTQIPDQKNPISYFSLLFLDFLKDILNKNKGLVEDSGVKIINDNILLWINYKNIKCTHKAINIFILLISSLNNQKPIDKKTYDSILVDFKNFTNRYHSYSPQFLSATKDLDIPSFQFVHDSIYRQYGWGAKAKIYHKASSMDTSFHGVNVSLDKTHTKEHLKYSGMPIVKSILVNQPEQILEASNQIGFPCVVKPNKGKQGIGITVNIQSIQELKIAYQNAKNSVFGNNPIMIEEHVEGDTHRIMVIKGKFYMTLRKRAPIIVGDGKSTIKNLIDSVNKDRESVNNNLKKIIVDEELIKYLDRYNLSLETILNDGFELKFYNIFNYVQGAYLDDVTEITHPDIIKMAETVAKLSAIDTLGIDYISTDISKSFLETKGAINEYNHTPSLKLFEPLKNFKMTNIVKRILGDNIGRIPFNLIITDDKNLEVFKEWLKKQNIPDGVGCLCDNLIQIGKFPLCSYDNIGWTSVKTILRNRDVEKVIVVCTINEIINKGLPVDKCDVIFLDHKIEFSENWLKVLTQSTSKLEKFDTLDNITKFINLGD